MTPDDLTIAESNLRIAAANYEHTRRGQDAAFAEACSTLLQAARNFVDAERGEAKIEAEYGNFAALYDQIGKWSVETFGPGDRSDAVVAHIRKELMEIEATPSDVTEWVDVAILAMDGARRSAGADGAAFVDALLAKHERNTRRTWPDWRTAPEGKPIEHVREESPDQMVKRLWDLAVSNGRHSSSAAPVHPSSLTDALAVAEYETSKARDHVRALLAILDEIGGYRTTEQQDAVRAARESV